jgi:type I restriction enzyme S subunit
MSNWQTKALGDLVTDPITYGIVQPGGFTKNGILLIRGKDYMQGWAGEGEFFRVSPELHDQYKRSKVTKGDLLLSIAGYVGEVAIVPNWIGEANITQTTARIRCNEEILSSRYLLYFLQSDNGREISKKFSKGSAQSGLNLADIAKFEIPLPPLPEQKKIAEILSRIDTTIAQLKLKAQKLDALHFSLAEALFEALHRDGEPSALQEFAEIRTGIAKNSSDEGDMAELPYMRVANVQDGYLDLSEIKTINVDKSRVARYLLQKGDVLINEGGDLDKVGRGVIWHGEIRDCLHQNHVFAVRCSDRLMPEFLSLLLRTSYSKNYFLGCAKQTTNLASINSTQLKSFPIPLLSLSAQKEFINHIMSINKSISSVSKKISSLTAMKKAISSDLLSARKRVTL